MYLFLKPSFLYVALIWLFLWWVSAQWWVTASVIGYCISANVSYCTITASLHLFFLTSCKSRHQPFSSLSEVIFESVRIPNNSFIRQLKAAQLLLQASE